MADQKYKMKIMLEVIGDQGHVHRAHAEYENMSYDAMQGAQGAVIGSLVSLGDAKMSTKAG